MKFGFKVVGADEVAAEVGHGYGGGVGDPVVVEVRACERWLLWKALTVGDDPAERHEHLVVVVGGGHTDTTGTQLTVMPRVRRAARHGGCSRDGRYPPTVNRVEPVPGAHRLNGVAEIADVAERGGALVGTPDQAEQVRRQRLGHLAWHRQVLVLLLAEPRHVVGDVQADVGAGGMVKRPHRGTRCPRRTAPSCGDISRWLGVVGTERELVLAGSCCPSPPGLAPFSLGYVSRSGPQIVLHCTS